METTDKRFREIFSIEGRKKLFGTVLILALIRAAIQVRIPGMDAEALTSVTVYVTRPGLIATIMDACTGGAFSHAAIFAIGIVPFAVMSLFFFVAGKIIPAFRRADGNARTIDRWTFVSALALAVVSGFRLSIDWNNTLSGLGEAVVSDEVRGGAFILLSTGILAFGAVLLSWIAAWLTKHGVGNGVVLILSSGVIGRLVAASLPEDERIVAYGLEFICLVLLCILSLDIKLAGNRKRGILESTDPV